MGELQVTDAVNEILFGLTYTEAITDETVQWNADSAVHFSRH